MSNNIKFTKELIKIANVFDENGQTEIADEITKIAQNLSKNIKISQTQAEVQPQQVEQQSIDLTSAMAQMQKLTLQLMLKASKKATRTNDAALQQKIQNFMNLQKQYFASLSDIQKNSKTSRFGLVSAPQVQPGVSPQPAPTQPAVSAQPVPTPTPPVK